MGIISPDIREFVNRNKLGFAATVCPDGTPNLSPKGTTIAWDEDHLVFADIHSPGTINNLLANPGIEINVVDVFTRKGYRFKGVARIYSTGDIFEEVVAAYRNAGARYIINHIAMIKVDRILPVISPAYDSQVSEAEVMERWIDYWNSIHMKK
jgi:uncharacterized protein